MILPTQPRQVKTARVSVPGSVCKRFGVSIKQQVRVQKRQMTQIRSEATCGRDVKTFRALEATELGEDFFESIDQYNGTLLFFAHTLCPFAERTWLTLLEKVCACVVFCCSQRGPDLQGLYRPHIRNAFVCPIPSGGKPSQRVWY